MASRAFPEVEFRFEFRDGGSIGPNAFALPSGIIVFTVWVNTGWSYELLAVPAFAVIALAALWLMRTLAWWFPDQASRLFESRDPDEMGIRFSLALLFVFVGLSILLGMDPILGAFLAGAMFAFVFRNSGELEERLSGFAYGFLIPVFFISVGIRFPLDALADTSVRVAALSIIVIAIAAKLVPAPLLVFQRLSLRDSLGTGVLLAGQLSVIIALAEVGVAAEIIDEGLSAGAVLLVGVTALLSPVVFRLLSPAIDAEEEARSLA